jgi:EmrB/QacA subfamily drug resistance transporter
MNTNARRWLAVGILSLGGLIVGLDTTVLNVALPTLAKDLHASTSQLQWFAAAYLLALAVLLLPGGLLGDKFGRKPMTVLSLLIFGAGSLSSAYAGSAEILIAARALMGLGAAFLTPLTFSWMVSLFDERERPKALGVLGGASFIGLPLGPVLAGWLLNHYFWGSVFLINVPLIAIAVVGAALFLPGGGAREDRAVDWIGIVLSVVGLAGLTYGLIEAPARGWLEPRVLVTGVGGLAVLAGFVRWQKAQGPRALMDLSVWRLPEFSWGTSVLVVSTMLGMVALFSVPLYLQGILGVDAFGSGLRLAPIIGGIILGVGVTVIVSPRLGFKAPILAGLALIAMGSVLATRTTLESTYNWTAMWLVVFGSGFGAIMIGGNSLALNKLDPARSGVGGAVLQMMRQTGSVVGIAVLISVLNSVYRGRVDLTSVPADARETARSSLQGGFAVAQRFGDADLVVSVKNAFLDGMDAQMWLGVGLAILTALTVLIWMPWRLGYAEPEADDWRTGAPDQ